MLARLILVSSLILSASVVARTPEEPSRFGGAFDAARQGATAAAKTEYAQLPLTLECWARLDSKQGFNILVAHGLKESPAHWELYTTAGTGTLAAYVPGASPGVLTSDQDVCDGRWHHLALVHEPDRVRLFVDARSVLDQPVQRVAASTEAGTLWLGAYPPQRIRCDGRIDEVHLRRGAFPPSALPDAPPSVTPETVGLWHLDSIEDERFDDSSPLRNAAVPGAGLDTPPEFEEGAALSYRPGSPDLKVELLDRSLDESLIAVRLDTSGRIFVGGREAVFAYDPRDDGGYGPRQELYRFPPHSWVGDIEILGDDLYVATASAIYRLPGARRKRDGIDAKRLVWGAPVDLHVTYHGLAFGPQGDLYFNCGDPLLNHGDFNRADHWGHWTLFSGPDATPTPYTGTGGVFRVRPDGSDLQVVATGLRGTDGLAFDKNYDLFTDDNDHESIPDRYTPYRILHVTPGADFAWPRGWAAHRSPDRSDLLAIANDGLDRGVPVGLAYHGGGGLTDSGEEVLLVAQWGHRTIATMPIRPRGASLSVSDGPPLLIAEDRARPVGVAVGRDDRVFATIAYMAQNEGSPTYPSDLVMISRADDPADHPFKPYEAPDAPADRLWEDLSNPSMSRRDAAHREILRRGGPLLAEATRRLGTVDPANPARLHLVWLAAASRSVEATRLLNELTGDSDANMRLQAVRALGESAEAPSSSAALERALEDPDPRVVLAALDGLARLDGPVLETVVNGPARSGDTYLRQSATRYLAAHASLDRLESLLRSEDSATRLAAVLALGVRLTVPATTAPLPEGLALSYTSGNAAFTLRLADGEVELRELGPVGSFTTADLWRLEPRTPEQERGFAALLSALGDPDDRVRLQAAYWLSLLNDPRGEPRIAEATGEVEARRLAAAPLKAVPEVWIAGPFADPEVARTVEGRPIDLDQNFPGANGPTSWQRLASPEGTYPLEPAEGALTYAYIRLQSLTRAGALIQVESDDAVKIWHDGRPVYENTVGSIHGFRNVDRLDLRPGANDLLIRLRHRDEGSSVRIAVRSLEGVAIEVPERLGIAGLADRLRDAGSGDGVPEAFLAVDWTRAVSEGDPARGRRLFSADGIGCARCHAVAPGEAGGGAPSLADADKRFTVAHLVESVLTPSRQIAPVFQGTTLALADGRILNGLIVNETPETVELLLPDASRLPVPSAEIEARRPMDRSAMPAGLVKSPDELRDLLAFLLGETDPKP